MLRRRDKANSCSYLFDNIPRKLRDDYKVYCHEVLGKYVNERLIEFMKLELDEYGRLLGKEMKIAKNKANYGYGSERPEYKEEDKEVKRA